MKKGTREWEISLKNTRLEASSVASPPCCRIVGLLFANFKRYRIRFRYNVCFAATKIQHFACDLVCDYPANKLTIVSYSFIRSHLPIVFPCSFNRDKHFRLRFVSKIYKSLTNHVGSSSSSLGPRWKSTSTRMQVDKRITSRSRCPSAFDSRYSSARTKIFVPLSPVAIWLSPRPTSHPFALQGWHTIRRGDISGVHEHCGRESAG